MTAPRMCPPCNGACDQGRTCPARKRVGSLSALIAALLALTACSETSTEWNYNDAIFLGAGDSGFGAPSAGHSDPSGVVGVDSDADGDDAASDDAGSGHDDSGSGGDVGKGHDSDHDDGEDD